jgi:8-oxo-dGTP diphosphatase
MIDKSNRPQVGVGMMILRNGQVLLGKRQGAHGADTYGWVGGHLEFGETLEDGCRREALEETGLEIKTLKLICVSNIIQYDKHYLDLEFLATIDPQAEPQVLEPDKVESWQWYDLDKLPKPLFKAVELAINSYHSGQVYNP